MILNRNLADEKSPDRLNLFLGNRRSSSGWANEADYSACSEDANAVSREIGYSHKCIPGKERQFDFCATIAPLPHRSHHGQVNRDALRVQFARRDLFMTRACANRVPLRVTVGPFKSNRQRNGVYKLASRTQSSALSVTLLTATKPRKRKWLPHHTCGT